MEIIEGRKTDKMLHTVERELLLHLRKNLKALATKGKNTSLFGELKSYCILGILIPA